MPTTTKSPAAKVVNVKPKRLSEMQRTSLTGRYDAAQTTDENARHWSNADSLSARAAHSPSVRRVLRVRSRYEIANCPLAGSILRKLADAVVGTGPRLQLKTRDRDYNRAVERAFAKWIIATGFSRKLWQMRYNKAMNGEALAVAMTNPRLAHPVKLDLRTVEADQLANPRIEPENGSDGIIFDDFGNPVGYTILRRHPGDTFAVPTLPGDFDTWPADDVLHYYAAERPSQVRGVPEITAALPYLSMRRRYILAVIAAAESAADIAGLLETQGLTEDPEDVAPLDAIEYERRMLMTLPRGYKLSQLKAEQPTTTLEMFDGVIIREIGRCVNMPFGIAGSNSSGYNFASGKLDHLPWLQTVRIEQDHIEDAVADPVFAKWFAEASRLDGYLPPRPDAEQIGLYEQNDPPAHQWFWDGHDLLDPREAGAKATGLKNGFDFHGRIAAKRGEDIIDEWEAQAELYGITVDEYRQLVLKSVFGTAAEEEQPDAGNGNGGDDDEDQ